MKWDAGKAEKVTKLSNTLVAFLWQIDKWLWQIPAVAGRFATKEGVTLSIKTIS